VGVGGEGAQLGLGQIADGEAGGGELRVREEGEEVGLILVLVAAFEEGEGLSL
jgi:hypothetical protein